MNGSKAKLLRKLAGVGKENGQAQGYHKDSTTVKTKSVKDIAGKHVWSYQTATIKLDAGSRLLYKKLKKAS
tara:strand:- start:179 stop:391 length:213 start_codon:yes stop_codon:yes gene_type:complete